MENLRASPFLISHIQQMMFECKVDRSKLVVVARHTSSMKKATAYAQRLRADIAVLHGSVEVDTDEVDGRSSPPPIRSIEFFPGGGQTLPMFTDHEAFRSTPMNLVGEVGGKIAIMVEDIIDDVDCFTAAARFLKEQGAEKVFLLATHALLSEERAAELNASAVDQIVVTNTVPIEYKLEKLVSIDIGVLLTEAIRRLHNQESLSYLFTDVSVED